MSRRSSAAVIRPARLAAAVAVQLSSTSSWLSRSREAQLWRLGSVWWRSSIIREASWWGPSLARGVEPGHAHLDRVIVRRASYPSSLPHYPPLGVRSGLETVTRGGHFGSRQDSGGLALDMLTL